MGLTTAYVAALVAVAVGLAIATLSQWFIAHDKLTRAPGDNEADLEERLAHFIAQLRDLEEQRGRLQDAEYTTQKAEFEARASDVLRRLKQPKELRAKKSDDAVPATPTVAWLASHPQIRGALWGGGTVGLLAMLYTLAVGEEHPRPEPMQGQRPPMMGGAPSAGGNADGAELRSLTERLQSNPDDLPALLRAGHLLMKNQMLEEAQVLTDRALKLSPQDNEALVHHAVLSAGKGNPEQAFMQLDAVLKRDSTFAEAWFFRGMLAMQQGKQDIMRESMMQFVRYAPDGPQKERIRAMLAK